MSQGGKRGRSPERARRFSIQKHWARGLHYDLRLEIAGRLVSWAVPKGPTRDPAIRRLAIRMPDHPLDYALFEGRIPPGAYGAGVVLVWDSGTYDALRPAGVPETRWLERGYLKFLLHGVKLHGLFELIRSDPGPGGKESWLWVKIRDRHVQTAYDPEIEPLSAVSGRSGDEIGRAEELRLLPPPERPLEAWGRPCAEEGFDGLE